MPEQLIAVDAQALERVLERLAQIEHILLHSKVTPPSKWITISEYAQKVSKSEATVRRWVRDGKLERHNGLVKNPDS
ncbi:MAG: hypothetical protein BM560_05150 [Roseobacter sp. MedPE-SWde]|nr:MAG: hypothetical protein BM560_05150 [Roseobacter sp. MedPE-SWde]